MYTVPHKPLRYFYNRELNIVTTEYMSNPESRLKFQSEYPNTSSKCHLLETVAHEGIVTVVDHEMETFGEDQFSHGLYIWDLHLLLSLTYIPKTKVGVVTGDMFIISHVIVSFQPMQKRKLCVFYN